jgi:hypothetical protein
LTSSGRPLHILGESNNIAVSAHRLLVPRPAIRCGAVYGVEASPSSPPQVARPTRLARPWHLPGQDRSRTSCSSHLGCPRSHPLRPAGSQYRCHLLGHGACSRRHHRGRVTKWGHWVKRSRRNAARSPWWGGRGHRPYALSSPRLLPSRLSVRAPHSLGDMGCAGIGPFEILHPLPRSVRQGTPQPSATETSVHCLQQFPPLEANRCPVSPCSSLLPDGAGSPPRSASRSHGSSEC